MNSLINNVNFVQNGHMIYFFSMEKNEYFKKKYAKTYFKLIEVNLETFDS